MRLYMSLLILSMYLIKTDLLRLVGIMVPLYSQLATQEAEAGGLLNPRVLIHLGQVSKTPFQKQEGDLALWCISTILAIWKV
jgi:hypothetical protein